MLPEGATGYRNRSCVSSCIRWYFHHAHLNGNYRLLAKQIGLVFCSTLQPVPSCVRNAKGKMVLCCPCAPERLACYVSRLWESSSMALVSLCYLMNSSEVASSVPKLYYFPFTPIVDSRHKCYLSVNIHILCNEPHEMLTFVVFVTVTFLCRVALIVLLLVSTSVGLMSLTRTALLLRRILLPLSAFIATTVTSLTTFVISIPFTRILIEWARCSGRSNERDCHWHRR